MPEMDGLALCRKIRKLPRDNYTYLVLLTSLEDKTNYLAAMDAGADEIAETQSLKLAAPCWHD
jgi:PleD family two-component response regulator